MLKNLKKVRIKTGDLSPTSLAMHRRINFCWRHIADLAIFCELWDLTGQSLYEIRQFDLNNLTYFASTVKYRNVQRRRNLWFCSVDFDVLTWHNDNVWSFELGLYEYSKEYHYFDVINQRFKDIYKLSALNEEGRPEKIELENDLSCLIGQTWTNAICFPFDKKSTNRWNGNVFYLFFSMKLNNSSSTVQHFFALFDLDSKTWRPLNLQHSSILYQDNLLMDLFVGSDTIIFMKSSIDKWFGDIDGMQLIIVSEDKEVVNKDAHFSVQRVSLNRPDSLANFSLNAINFHYPNLKTQKHRLFSHHLLCKCNPEFYRYNST